MRTRAYGYLLANPPAPRHSHGQLTGLQVGVNATLQMLSLRALATKAFTTFFAGFALTTYILPKISRLPAFVAGFVLVFSLQSPGNEKTPVLVTSFVAISAKALMTLVQTFCFNSQEVAKDFAIPDFVMLFAAFGAAFMAFGNIAKRKREDGEVREWDNRRGNGA